MACCNSTCIEIYKAALSDIPSKWAEQIANLLCQLDDEKFSGISCEKVQNCETLTSISDFSLSGNTLSLSYVDENGNTNVNTVPLTVIGSFINNQIAGTQTGNYWISGIGRAGSIDVTSINVPENGIFKPAVDTLGLSANGALVTTIAGDGLMTHKGNIFLDASISSQPAISFFLNTLAASDYYVQRIGTTLTMHSAGIGQVRSNVDTAFTVNANSNRGFEWQTGGNNLAQLFIDGSLLLMTTAVQQSPDTSAILELDSTTRGFLPSRMTTAQKNAIPSPSEGLVVYDTDLQKLCLYTNTWETITSV